MSWLETHIALDLLDKENQWEDDKLKHAREKADWEIEDSNNRYRLRQKEDELFEANLKLQHVDRRTMVDDINAEQAVKVPGLEKELEHYKDLLRQPMAEIASKNFDFRETYIIQQAVLSQLTVSLHSFKELAMQYGDKLGISPEQVKIDAKATEEQIKAHASQFKNEVTEEVLQSLNVAEEMAKVKVAREFEAQEKQRLLDEKEKAYQKSMDEFRERMAELQESQRQKDELKKQKDIIVSAAQASKAKLKSSWEFKMKLLSQFIFFGVSISLFLTVIINNGLGINLFQLSAVSIMMALTWSVAYKGLPKLLTALFNRGHDMNGITFGHKDKYRLAFSEVQQLICMKDRAALFAVTKTGATIAVAEHKSDAQLAEICELFPRELEVRHL